jgi:ribosomal subunit interface protein
MNCHFAFRGMGVSEALRDYAERKVEDRLGVYGGRRRPVDADITFEWEGNQFTVRGDVRGEDGFTAHVENSGGEMYGLIDLMMDKLSAQWRRHKERVKEHKMPHRITAMQGRAGEAAQGMSLEAWESWADGPKVVDAADIVAYERSKPTARPDGAALH